MAAAAVRVDGSPMPYYSELLLKVAATSLVFGIVLALLFSATSKGEAGFSSAQRGMVTALMLIVVIAVAGAALAFLWQ